MEIQFPRGSGGFLNPEIVIRGFGLKSGMQIADFGCGAGYFTIPIAQMVSPTGKIYAIDILEEQLSAVKARAGIYKLQNITYVRSDLEKENGSQLDNNSQDCVLAANLLYQVKDKETLMKEALRVLKKGGKLVVIDWREDTNFGPKEDRINPPAIKKMIEGLGFAFEKELMTDAYHWGMTFRK